MSPRAGAPNKHGYAEPQEAVLQREAAPALIDSVTDAIAAARALPSLP